MKKNQIIVSLAAAGMMALSSNASALSVGGINLGEAGFSFEFADIFEENKDGGPITTVGDELFGYGEVSSIRDNTGSLVWSRGDNGRELTFEFDGFIAAAVNPGGTGVDEIDFTGGSITFFSDTALDFDPISGTGYNNGTEWLNLAGVLQDFAGSHTTDYTLHSTGALLGTGVLSGTGTGLLEVDAGVGLANSIFDTDTFAYTDAAGTADLFADFDFNSSFTNTGSSIFDLEFNGTANLRGFTVPEPGSMALMGLGLLGFGVAARRKAKKA